MGVIIGLIGAGIVANAIGDTIVGIGDTIVEKQRVKENAKIEIEKIKLETERLKAKNELQKTKEQANALVKAAKINAQAEVAKTGMKTGFFAAAFGMKNGQNRLNYNNAGFIPTSTGNYIPQSTQSYIPQSNSGFVPQGIPSSQMLSGSYSQGQNVVQKDSYALPMTGSYHGFSEKVPEEKYVEPAKIVNKTVSYRFCNYCGDRFEEGTVFCPNCGIETN